MVEVVLIIIQQQKSQHGQNMFSLGNQVFWLYRLHMTVWG